MIRDHAEETGARLRCAESLVAEMLMDGASKPHDLMWYAGRLLEEIKAARQANDKTKEIIYEKRRRS